MLLERMIVTPLETRKKFRGKNIKRSSVTNKNGRAMDNLRKYRQRGVGIFIETLKLLVAFF